MQITNLLFTIVRLGIIWVSPLLFVFLEFLISIRVRKFYYISFTIMIFILALTYERLNSTGDIFNYRISFQQFCSQNELTNYQLLYLLWYLSMVPFCHFLWGFELFTAVWVSLGYLAVCITIDTCIRIKSSRHILSLVILGYALLLGFALPNVMSSYRTFVVFSMIAVVVSRYALVQNSSFNSQNYLLLAVTSFVHPISTIIVANFVWLFKIIPRSVLLLLLASAAYFTFQILLNVLLEKFSVYIVGEFASWTVESQSEYYKFLLTKYRKYVLIGFLCFSLFYFRNETSRLNSYFVFLIVILALSYLSRTIETRILIDGYSLFFALIFKLYFNSRGFGKIIVLMGCLSMADLRWIRLSSDSYSFDLSYVLSAAFWNS